MKVFRPATLAALLLTSTVAFGFGEPEHSKVEAKVEPVKAGSGLAFTFHVVENSDMAINLDGPWKLEITGHEGLNFDKTTLDKAAMDEKMPGFVIATVKTPEKPAGDLQYKLTSFICTKDKSKCFREIHKGKVDWQTAKN